MLIIRPSALGDVCRTVPVLASLKRAWPESRIDWLVRDVFADAISAHPGFAGQAGESGDGEVVPFPRRGLERWWLPGSAGSRALMSLLRRLRSLRYDVVLDCQGLLRSGLLTLATGAPKRIGHADAREGAPAAYTHGVDPGSAVHTVDRMLTLLAPLGVEVTRDMRLYVPPADLAAVDADARLGAGGGGTALRYALFAPTSRWVGKRWPAERFADLAKRLLARGIDRVVVVGSGEERDQCGPVLALAERERRVVDLIGATSVGRLMALVARSALVVANDSAALHMAVGLDRPIVGLYGPTEVARVGPYGRSADVIQHVRGGESLNHKDEGAGRVMMERISVEEVEARVLAVAARAN